MNDALSSAIARRRLATDDRDEDHCFTVDRTEALSRLRHRPGAGRWDWTLKLARATLALVDGARLWIGQRHDGERDVVRLCIAFDPAALDGMPQRKWLDHAIDPDPGPGDRSLVQRQRRFVRLLGGALNEALAFDPHGVRLELAGQVHRFEHLADGDDPWREHDAEPSAMPSPWTLDLQVAIERNRGRWLDQLLGTSALVSIIELWRKRVPGAEIMRDSGYLRGVPPWPPVRLGAHVHWWPLLDDRGLRLLQDGVVSNAALGGALRIHRVDLSALHGLVWAPELRTTFDERAVVLDDRLAEVAACFHAALAYPKRAEANYVSAGTSLLPILPVIGTRWPARIDTVWTADGRPITRAMLQQLAAGGQVLAFAWRHEVSSTPAELRPYTLALWPFELEMVMRAAPQLQLVPIAAYRVGTGDWTSILRTSLPELTLGTTATSEEMPVRIEVNAFVHRHGTGGGGRVVLADGATALDSSEHATLVIPGVTVLGRVRSGGGVKLPVAGQHAALRAAAALARTRIDAILAHALEATEASTHPEQLAVLMHAIAGLDAAALGLGYEVVDGAMHLRWRSHVLLELVVARTRTGEPVTLGVVLARLRDVGDTAGPDGTWRPTVTGASVLARLLPPPMLQPSSAIAEPQPSPSPTVIPPPRRRAPLLAVEIAVPGCTGELHLVDPDAPAVIDVWPGAAAAATPITLPAPLSAIGGRLWLRDVDPSIAATVMAQHAGTHAIALVERARRVHMLAAPGGIERRGLQRFLAGCGPAIASPPVEPPPFVWPTAEAQRLPALLVRALARFHRLERARFSWRAATVETGAELVIGIGAQHPWVARASTSTSLQSTTVLTAMLMTAIVLEQLDDDHEPSIAAMRRLLETLRE